VRYAESKSFEFDYVMPHAYQYRDDLIRTFNEDVPYDQFVRESFAGDLLDEPRYDPTGTSNGGAGTLRSCVPTMSVKRQRSIVFRSEQSKIIRHDLESAETAP